MESSTKKYEIGYLSSSETGSDELKKVLATYGAEVVEEGAVNRIKLAYPIKKEQFAFFSYIHFNVATNAIVKIKEDLKFVSSILRVLIIAEPVSAVLENKTREYASRERREIPKAEEERPKVKSAPTAELSNEELEKKLEEILN